MFIFQPPTRSVDAAFSATSGMRDGAKKLGAVLRAIFGTTLLSIATLMPAYAANWYVNGACAQSGNGAADSCATNSGAAGAWKSITDITSDPKPGDVINIHGAPTFNGSYSTGQSYYNLPSGLNGTPGNPIAIQNVAGESVVVDGAIDMHGSPTNWTAVGNGVYRCSSGTCTTDSPSAAVRFPTAIWYLRAGQTAEEILYLDMGPTSCTSSLAAGMFSYGSAGPVCAHLSDGSNPGAAQYMNMPFYQAGIGLNNFSAHDITFRVNGGGARPSGSFTWKRFVQYGFVMTSLQNTNITLDGLDIGYVVDRCVDVDDVGGTHAAGIVIIHNHIHHCGQEGIHDGNDHGPGVIAGNEIDHVQYDSGSQHWFQQCNNNTTGGCNVIGFNDKCTGMRIASSQSLYVHDNYLHDNCGGYYGAGYGIDTEVDFGDSSHTMILENNLIVNMTAGPDANNKTVAWFMQGTGPYNVTWRNNRAYLVDYCFSLDLGSSGNATVNFYNNTCAEPRIAGISHFGGDSGVASGTSTFINNVFYATTQSPSYLVDFDPSVWPGFSAPANNVFYCPHCTSGIAQYKGAVYASGTIGNLGSGNRYGDPGLNIAGNPPPLRILNTGAAYQAGVALSPVFADALGIARPATGAWDVGAIQYPGTGTAPPTPTNVRLQ